MRQQFRSDEHDDRQSRHDATGATSNASVEESQQVSGKISTSNRRIHPAIAWVFAALLIGTVIALRNTNSTIVTPEQANNLIDPGLRKPKMYVAEDARYKTTREVLESLQDNVDTDVRPIGDKGPIARALMPLGTGDDFTLNGITALLSGNFEPLGGQKAFWPQESQLTIVRLQSKASNDMDAGNRNAAVEMSKMEVSLYPMLDQSVGMDIAEYNKDSESMDQYKLANSLSVAGFNAQELQSILDSWHSLPTESNWAHDALRRTLSTDFVPLVLDQDRRFKLLAMLAIPHDLPVDEKGTIQEANKIFLAVDKNLKGDYAHRDTYPETALSSLSKEIDPLLEGDAFENQSTFQALQTRWTLWRHPNVTGKYLIYHEMPEVLAFQKNVFRNRTNIEADRLQLALTVYEKSHGSTAKDLNDLVTSKILPSVPIDPYSGQPFRYDPARNLIWSVGEDGKDDGGNPKSDILFQ